MNLFTSLLGNSNEEEPEEQKPKEKSFDFFCCFHAKYTPTYQGIISISRKT